MQTLISKKELLNLTNISYGQLYRWKRMNLIPEEWFIKKSTTTGQETFFEKDKILERIDYILTKKDELSLEEMSAIFQAKDEMTQYSMDPMGNKVISSDTIQLFYSLFAKETRITEQELFILAVMEEYVRTSVVTMAELKTVIELIEQRFESLLKEKARVQVYRKFGVSFALTVGEGSKLIVEKGATKVMDVSITNEVNRVIASWEENN